MSTYSRPRPRPRRRPAPAPLPGSRRAELLVALCFAVSVFSGLALLVLYIAGGQTQLEGILLMLCLGGIGMGIVLWVQELMDIHEAVEERHEFGSEEATGDLLDTLTEERGFTRRKWLIGALIAALGGLGAALLIPLFSLGPAPGRSLFLTSWRKGLKLVRQDGTAVHEGDLSVGGILTVFPDGHVGEADSATILIRLQPGTQLPPDKAKNAPNGYIALSKVCTHAGCPVGLYRASQQTLICPCHQSTFDVTKGAVPVFGPAVRPLPQLPIQIQPDGTFVATGPYPEPVGPSFWNMHLGNTQP